MPRMMDAAAGRTVNTLPNRSDMKAVRGRNISWGMWVTVKNTPSCPGPKPLALPSRGIKAKRPPCLFATMARLNRHAETNPG